MAGEAMGKWIRGLSVLSLLLAVAAPVQALTDAQARHLLVRSGFDRPPADYQRWLKADREEAVARLLSDTRTDPALAAPDWAEAPVLSVYNEVQRSGEPRAQVSKRVRQQQSQWQRELEEWLLANTVLSEHPLAERMTAFWHNRFTSSFTKVGNAQLLYRQHMFLRRHALGNFETLLRGIVRDPAMLIYLDNRQNRKDHPNENLARELLELFSLGEGHYTEQDIREAARALSGWSLDGDLAFQIRTRQHDAGEKVIFGQRGRFDGDDLVSLILQQPATAEFLVAALWREFISPQPDPQLVSRWAAQLREQHYEIQPLLETIFLSDAFWDPRHRGVLIKSPLQLVAGTLRAFSIAPRDYRPLVVAMRRMGQWLLNPPNVKGWPGYTDWIDASRWLTRRSFLHRLLSTPQGPAQGGAMDNPMRSGGVLQTDAAPPALYGTGMARSRLQSLLLVSAPVQPLPPGATREATIKHWALDPVYQLY
ncbi:DUF1800 domain-containing protein [Granulosicoccaceae sp. 1_MG-2023]|nr:DUF1800 domain-containing protein [Granulosicoccaceae sp. 1_MG-2023]